MKFRSKKEVTDGSQKHGLSPIRFGLDEDSISKLKDIAAENKTFVSEIIRQVVVDFISEYEREHKEKAKQ